MFNISISTEGEITTSSQSQRKIRELKGKSIIDFPTEYVVLDIETTGLDPLYDEIIELSAIRVVDDVQVDSFSSLVKPINSIDDFITGLTGITNDMVSKAPSIEDILPQFCEFVGGNVIVGHNVNFDINFIYDNLMECSNKAFENEFIDLLRIARRTLPELKNHKLKTLSEHFEVDTTGAHRGMKDCNMTNECFRYCRDIAIQKFENIDAFIKIFSKYGGHKVMAKDIKAANCEFSEEHPLFNQVCVFTGTLEKTARKDAMQCVVNVGGKCGDGLTKKTNYLIVGSLEYSSNVKGNKSSKIIKAEKYILGGLDIKIISENTFEDLLNE